MKYFVTLSIFLLASHIPARWLAKCFKSSSENNKTEFLLMLVFNSYYLKVSLGSDSLAAK